MHSAKPKALSSISSATGGIARLACSRLREHGKNVGAVLSKVGLTLEEANDPTVRLEVSTQIKVLDLAAEALGDQILGFRLAHHFDLREIGLVYYVIASSQQLVDALTNAERYSRIANEGVRLRFKQDRTSSISLDYVNVERRFDRHQIEFWLVTLTRICREVTRTRIAPLLVKIKHLRTAEPVEFKSFFGCEIRFGADADEIILGREVASLPVISQDQHLNRLLRQYAEEALARRSDQTTSVRGNVEKHLIQHLPHGDVAASTIARKLGMSSRTLSRKLADERTTYAEILDGLRIVLAKRYLVEEELPVSEVAWLLGYKEVSSLTHAFRRWTGKTPRQFRRSRARRYKQ